jgi:hypothetical protein
MAYDDAFDSGVENAYESAAGESRLWERWRRRRTASAFLRGWRALRTAPSLSRSVRRRQWRVRL